MRKLYANFHIFPFKKEFFLQKYVTVIWFGHNQKSIWYFKHPLETWQFILPFFSLFVVSEASSSSESESILKSTKDGASSLFFSSEIRLPLLTRSITEEICFLILVVSFASSKVIGVAPWFKEFYRTCNVWPLACDF